MDSATATAIQDEVAERLVFANGLLSAVRLPGGIWPRCCVWLLRTALERTVSAVLRSHDEPDTSPRTDLLTLPLYADPRIASATSRLWEALTRVANHQDYELAPTAAELRKWHTEAVRTTTALFAEVDTAAR
ncbi:hypothetical protein [Umezawaea tangerina]|uniref:HEPN domain-containing protein n=1 Tax=Umezawaea tangerina TaxID=84725 RepID=A0A2T0SC78_9PSEU|nr:hypothetical protein [Umezawaea tangerina]PRY31027.1 hypothetical protein CLV43_123129 [Umezawaea tangerina]